MPSYNGVAPKFSFVPGGEAFAKYRPIPFDYDNTSLLESQAEAVHARFKNIKVPDIYGPPSSVAQPDIRAFNGGQVIVPPQSAPSQ